MHVAVPLGVLQLISMGVVPTAGTELARMPPGYTLQYYDDCGGRGRQPHVPAQVGHTFSSSQVDGDEQARSVTYGVPHFDVVYEGLEEGTPYAMVVTYASERGNPRVQRLTAGSVVLHGPLALPEGCAQRLVFAVPPEAVAQGKLTLSFHCESGHNAVASVIELWAPLPARNGLHLRLTPDVKGMLGGSVEDVLYAPISGASISVRNVGTGACIGAQTGADSMFSVDVSTQVAEAKSGSFLVLAWHEGMEATANVSFDELRFDLHQSSLT